MFALLIFSLWDWVGLGGRLFEIPSPYIIQSFPRKFNNTPIIMFAFHIFQVNIFLAAPLEVRWPQEFHHCHHQHQSVSHNKQYQNFCGYTSNADISAVTIHQQRPKKSKCERFCQINRFTYTLNYEKLNFLCHHNAHNVSVHAKKKQVRKGTKVGRGHIGCVGY